MVGRNLSQHSLLCFFLFLLFCSGLTSAYNFVVDQENWLYNSNTPAQFWGGAPLWQSFTPEKNDIAVVSLLLARSTLANYPNLTIQVGIKEYNKRETNEYLGKTNIAYSDILKNPGGLGLRWVNASFSSPIHLPIVDGSTQYWIELKLTGGNYYNLSDNFIVYSGFDDYADRYNKGGSYIGYPPVYRAKDIAFVTYSAVPECLYADEHCGPSGFRRFCSYGQYGDLPADHTTVYETNFQYLCEASPNGVLYNKCVYGRDWSSPVEPYETCTTDETKWSKYCMEAASGSGAYCRESDFSDTEYENCLKNAYVILIPQKVAGAIFKMGGPLIEVHGNIAYSVGEGVTQQQDQEVMARWGKYTAAGSTLLINCVAFTIGAPETVPVTGPVCIAAEGVLTLAELSEKVSVCTNLYYGDEEQKRWRQAYVTVTDGLLSHANKQFETPYWNIFDGWYNCVWNTYDPRVIRGFMSGNMDPSAVAEYCTKIEEGEKGGSGGLFFNDVLRNAYSNPGEGDAFKRSCKFQSGLNPDCSPIVGNTRLQDFNFSQLDLFSHYVVYKNTNYLTAYGFNYSCDNSNNCNADIGVFEYTPVGRLKEQNSVESEYAAFVEQQKTKYNPEGVLKILNDSSVITIPPWTISKDASLLVESGVNNRFYSVSTSDGELYNSYLVALQPTSSYLDNPASWDAAYHGSEWVGIKAIPDRNNYFLKELTHFSDFSQIESATSRETTSPVITILNPTQSVYSWGEPLSLAYTTQDASGIQDFASFIDNVKVGRNSRIYSSIFIDGIHTFKVAALDGSGNEAVKNVSFELRRVPGDVNIDAKVTLADAMIVARKIGVNVTSEYYDAFADLNEDWVINQTDLDLVFEELN
ncbi:MAG: dockerin type I domain-containing protein [Candidatus Micrarchaeota archaeon]